MDYDCETNNMNQVYCCQCQRNFRLGFDELYSEQLIGDDYAEDGSLIPSYNYTCSTCYFKGQPASIGKINATAIDILRKVDNYGLKNFLRISMGIIKRGVIISLWQWYGERQCSSFSLRS